MSIISKKTILMATIPQRQSKLLEIVSRLYPFVDELRIVFNNYQSIPNWVNNYPKIIWKLNTPDHYTCNAIWLMMNDVKGYIFTCDDDILYPSDYVNKMIDKLEQYNRKVLLSMYGEICPRPFKDYLIDRKGYMFTYETDRDIFVDIAGAGCSVFHTDTLYPTINDFPDVYSRDLWLSILCHKNKIPIVRPKSCKNWLKSYPSINSPEIRLIWRSNKKYVDRRREIYQNIMIPLLNEKEPHKC